MPTSSPHKSTTTSQHAILNSAQPLSQLLAKPTPFLFFTGKGGVGKTSIAAATALALASQPTCASQKSAKVLIISTDPASNLDQVLGLKLTNHPQAVPSTPNLFALNIDPKLETANYIRETLAAQPADTDPEHLALLEEDLRSPCTEEIAVFRAFARTVAHASAELAILDTAPTGHTLLLIDATQAYHRELSRQTQSSTQPNEILQLLPRLQDPTFTKILIITHAETTPAQEAHSLQQDLKRAQITPTAWVINHSLAASHSQTPIHHSTLLARATSELSIVDHITSKLAGDLPTYLVPWQLEEPTGAANLLTLATSAH